MLGRYFGGHGDNVVEWMGRRAGVAAAALVEAPRRKSRSRLPWNAPVRRWFLPQKDLRASPAHGHASVQLQLGSLVPPAPCPCCRLFPLLPPGHIAYTLKLNILTPIFFAIRLPPAPRTAPERCCVHSKTLNAPSRALLHWALLTRIASCRAHSAPRLPHPALLPRPQQLPRSRARPPNCHPYSSTAPPA